MVTARQQLGALYDLANREDDDRRYAELEDAFDRAYDATVAAGVPEDAPDDVWEEARAATALALLGVAV